jgi:hypothetical protein
MKQVAKEYHPILRTGKVVKEISLPFCPDLASSSTEKVKFAAHNHSANGTAMLQQYVSYLNLG